jgi:hypothetical protein
MLSFLISSGVIASVPKSRRKGVKPVALDTIVLWDWITFGNSSTHLPFFWSNKHFLIPKKSGHLPFQLLRWTADDTLTKISHEYPRSCNILWKCNSRTVSHCQ